ncbi:MAG: hypothetical protein ASARMPREDX12_005082 [Alectoria sarmentosa]|nr:MAG: hypothetical protein ASARMPREDX12_005082 [Alectoria sarmentosa]
MTTSERYPEPSSSKYLCTVTIMAKFTNLSNEVVITIAPHIQKPADILHLCIAKRRNYAINPPLLYENISLHHLDYPTHEQHSLNKNLISLYRLLRQRQQENRRKNRHSTNSGEKCRSLAIHMHNSMGCPTANALELLSYLPFSRNLSLISSRRHHDHRQRFTISVHNVGQTLHPLRNMHESVTLSTGRNEDQCSKGGIGSLHHLKAMKQLHNPDPCALLGWDKP